MCTCTCTYHLSHFVCCLFVSTVCSFVIANRCIFGKSISNKRSSVKKDHCSLIGLFLVHVNILLMMCMCG